MHLDVFTALAASTAVVFLNALALSIFWFRSRASHWLAWWAAAFFIVGVGNCLVIISPSSPKPLAFAAGSAVFFVGFGLIWQAARVFEGRRPMPWVLAALSIVPACATALPQVGADTGLRVIAVSLPLTGALVLAAWEIWRGRQEKLPSRIALVGALLLAALLVGMRVPFGKLAAYPLGAEAPNQAVVFFLVGGLILISMVLSLLMVAISLERAELGQRRLAATDPLTGLLNRRGLDASFEDGRLPPGAAVIVFDLDQFKQVNDTFGHAAGDALIAGFALICREELHQVDLAARLGGEEFALVLARADAHAALILAERIRERYERMVVEIEGGAIAGTVSGGVFACAKSEPVWLSGALAEADRAMYQAKTAGRNRVFVSESVASASQGFDERCVAPPARAASV